MIKTTSKGALLAEYRKMYGISFPPFILNSSFAFNTISTYKCKVCGTISYYPKILGDALYYNYLSNNLSGYYFEERWEFKIALEVLDKEDADQFLEVGCGAGHFLRLARKRGHEGHGYEIDPHVVETLKLQGFQMLTDLNQDLAEYDALLMFQVLEHLLDPSAFLESMIPHVRSKGVVIISTPVTPSCASISSCALLLPPHHQWLPTTLGFKLLADRLGLACEKIDCSPPNSYQVEYALKKRFGDLPYLNILSGLWWDRVARLLLKIARAMRREWANVGHTGLVILRKA
jgi:SAM-dependent methyltransferase